MKTAPCCQLLEGQLESLLSLSGCRHIACHREGNKFTRTASPSVTNRDTAETKGQAPSQSWGLISPRAGARRRRAARGLARTEVPPRPSPGTHGAASFCEPKGQALSFEMSVFTSKTSCQSLQTLLMGLSLVPNPRGCHLPARGFPGHRSHAGHLPPRMARSVWAARRRKLEDQAGRPFVWGQMAGSLHY